MGHTARAAGAHSQATAARASLAHRSVAAHAMHVASAQLDAEAVKYSPAGQVVFLVAHDVTAFVPVLNSSAAQAVHVASALEDPAVKYLPAAHDGVRVWHGP